MDTNSDAETLENAKLLGKNLVRPTAMPLMDFRQSYFQYLIDNVDGRQLLKLVKSNKWFIPPEFKLTRCNKNDSGKVVLIDDIIDLTPNIYGLYIIGETFRSVTVKMAYKLLQTNVQFMRLLKAPDYFDLKNFLEIMKMAAKDKFPFSSKHQSFVDSHRTNNGSQYSNLNLNENPKSSNLSFVQSYSKTSNDKKSDLRTAATFVAENSVAYGNYEGKEKSQKLDKSSSKNDSCANFSDSVIHNDKKEVDKRWKKKSDSSNTNKSTLSLHIAAYENSVEATDCAGNNSKSLRKKISALNKPISVSSFLIQNPFEFPRQQNDKTQKPEMSQFKASQRLLKPDERSKKAKSMPKLNTSLLPPPPPPPVITLDDDDDEKREDGELSDEGPTEVKPETNRRKPKKSKKKQQEVIPDTPAEGSDIEIVGANIFDFDDTGADDDGLDVTMNIDDDEVFKKMQQAAGINSEDVDITINISETPKANRGQGTCFNCGGPHILGDCNLPHDRRKINRNRQSFGSTRRERITERTESKYVPGKLSEEALKALNLYDDEYPQWILRMRDMGPFEGYPPAYLKRFKPSEKRLSFYCDDPNLTNEVVKPEINFDPEKIVYYDGFNLIDRHSEAEKRCNQNTRKEFQWKKWNKISYAAEFKNFLEDSVKQEKIIESRKRQYYSDNQPPLSKKDKKKAKQAAEREAEKEKKRWLNYKMEQAKEKLIKDFKNTNFEEEPEKIHMLDENYGIFESKKQRKKIDRGKSRSLRSLEEEAKWINTMAEEEKAAAKAKTDRERLAKQEKAEKERIPKTWEIKRAEKAAQKKAEREERDKRRLKVVKKLVETGTQTKRVRILSCSDSEEGEASAVPSNQDQQRKEKAHGAFIMSKLLPFLSVEAKVAKEESHAEDVASRDVHPTLTEKALDKETGVTNMHESVESAKPAASEEKLVRDQVLGSKTTESVEVNEVSQIMDDVLDKLEAATAEKEKRSHDNNVSIKVQPSKVKDTEHDDHVDIVTVKQQQQEKLLVSNALFQNASKSFQSPSFEGPQASKPKPKKPYSSDDESSDDSFPPRKDPDSSKPKEKKPLFNPPVSKAELNKFKKSKEKSGNQISAKDTVPAEIHKTDDKKQEPLPSSKSSLSVKQPKGKQYGSDPNLSTSKIHITCTPMAKSKQQKLLTNPPISKEELNKSKKSKDQPVAKEAKVPNKKQQPHVEEKVGNQTSAKNSQRTTQPSKKQQEQPKNVSSNGNPAPGNPKFNKHARTFFQTVKNYDENSEDHRNYPKRHQEKSNYNKKKGQRNDPPMEDFSDYGAPLTNAEARILSGLEVTDSKPKVSAPRKQSEREKGRYKHDPQIPSSSKNYGNKGRYDSDANAAGPSRSGNQERQSTHTVFPDTPASPELPPVVSRAMTEDQATPKTFLVPVFDQTQRPKNENFAVGITPFQYDNQTERKGTLDILEQLIKSVKKD